VLVTKQNSMKRWKAVLTLVVASVCVGAAQSGFAGQGVSGAANPVQSGAPKPGQVSSVPRLDRLPQPLQGRPVDVASIARGFEAAGASAVGRGLEQGPQLLVFVSLSMPDGALRKLVEQAERTRAVLVLRGLKDGSMVKTAAAVRRLLGERKAALQIDPQGFDRFGVNQVPTFVLLRDGTQAQRCADASCVPASSYATLAGDVTIEYALEWIEAHSSGAQREAKVLLQRLRE
jgi:conjugal transfer pilus assembly protein TrbC